MNSLERVEGSGISGYTWSLDVYENKGDRMVWPVFTEPLFGQTGKVSCLLPEEWARALTEEFDPEGGWRTTIEVVVTEASYGPLRQRYYAALLTNVARLDGSWMAVEK